MRVLAAVLIAALLLIQWPLWFGKGGWLRAHELSREVDTQLTQNRELAERNQALAAELRSLRDGREAIEERARHELHMTRDDEVLFQLVKPAQREAPVAPVAR
jgi:cell division protein FtsB